MGRCGLNDVGPCRCTAARHCGADARTRDGEGEAMTRLGLVLAAAMLVVGATSLACQVDTGRPTNERLRGVSRDDSIRSMGAYIRSIPDSEFVTGTGAVDEQRLRICRAHACRYGPLAVIQPRARITDSGSTTLESG